MSARSPCAVCGMPAPPPFFRLDAVPVHQNVLLRSRPEALVADMGTIELGFCRTCGFIGNTRFDPTRLCYSPSYENTQGCSPSFQAYLAEVVAHLTQRHGLHGKRVIEIGCGKGDFLALLCTSGDHQGIGFDPSFEPDRTALPSSVQIVRDFYSERYAGYEADLVCCRHTLEHVAEPVPFLRQVRRALGEHESAVFFEVPDVRWILAGVAFWDICYEHCNYFSPSSLAYLFERCGFGSVCISTAFGGQYLWIEAVATSPGPPSVPADAEMAALSNAVARFGQAHTHRMHEARAAIATAHRERRRLIVWGAGAKGVMFLNALGVGHEVIHYVVDINPRKQGCFIAGTGQEIVSPEFLSEYKPDIVFVMNPNYLREIQAELDRMGLHPAVVVA